MEKLNSIEDLQEVLKKLNERIEDLELKNKLITPEQYEIGILIKRILLLENKPRLLIQIPAAFFVAILWLLGILIISIWIR